MAKGFFVDARFVRIFAKQAMLILLISFLVPLAPARALAACSANGAAQNSITVTPSHGSAFYVDYGSNVNPKIDASYIGYQVTLAANASTDLQNIWVKLSTFTGGVVSLANAADDKMQIASLARGTSNTVFFLMKATGATLTDQSHRVEVYEGDPSATGASLKYTCLYTFLEVDDVIAANPNKVNSVTLNNPTPKLGDLVTVTVQGDPGTIGSGKAPDNDIMWLSPAPYSNFQTRAVRLESVTLTNTNRKVNTCPTTYENTLLVRNAASCFTNAYTAEYRFRIIGASQTLVRFSPYANIASGNEIKHTAIDPTKSITLNLSNISASDFAIKKEVPTLTGLSESGGFVTVPYRLTISTTSTTAVSLDRVVDSATVTASGFVAGSASFTDNSRTSATSIVPETRGGDGKLYFVGPFFLTSSRSLVINYSMRVPVNTTTQNSASAFIGDVEVTRTSSANDFRAINVTTPGCTGTCVVSTSGVVAYVAPSATTNAATNISATQATLNGQYQTGGDPNSSIIFTWGSGNNLTNPQNINLGTVSIDGETSTVLTGLTAGTTYSYRISITNSVGTATGGIVTFVAGAPTATTLLANSITATSGTIRGSYTTGGGAQTAVSLTFSTDSNLSGSTTVDMGTTTTPGETSTALSGLTPSTLYYYRISALSGQIIANGEILSFTTLAPIATTVNASSVTSTGATLNGTIGTGGGVATTPRFVFGTSPTLVGGTTEVLPNISTDGNVSFSLTGLTASTTYYFMVTAQIGSYTDSGTILSFQTPAAAAPAPAPLVPAAPPAPVIQWSNPANITYPTPLSGTQLNAVAVCKGSSSIPGTYTYEPVLGTILSAGTHTLRVTWTPLHANDCTSLSATVTINVLAPAAPTITWVNPAPQVGPYNLGQTQLNATCSVPGTLTYTPASATLLQPGSYTLKVTCNPTDPNIPPVTAEVPFTVTRPVPTITWSDPTPVAGPFTLNQSVLNAVCSQPGTLTYDPAAGTVYQPGTYTLRVTCTPTNPLYGPVSATVTLRVVSANPITIPQQVVPGLVTTSLAVPAAISNLSPVVVSLCEGISAAVISGGQFSYTPVNTFSGKSCINVRVVVNGVAQIVQVPVLVNPIAPVAIKQPVTFQEGLITWTVSPNATSYKVEIRGKTICTTTELRCEAPQTVGPATPVLVTALGNDNTATTVEAKYEAKRVLAFTVYFDVAKFNLKPAAVQTLNRVAAIIKREGFTNISVVGHTDSSAFDNRTLSINRAKSSLGHLTKRVTFSQTRTSAKAEKVPAASNRTAQGKSLNRRVEGFVS